MAIGDREQLEQAIAAQEQLRGVVPDAIVDAGVSVMRQQLAAMGDGGRRRRLVTVVFADVTGFTEMSARLDAEVVSERMNDLWLVLDRVILDHGGRIDKHIGDAVMALWGADGTQEDDPEQAVRAALALQATLRERREAYGATVRMRVGVNTGPVLLGGVGTAGEFTAIGDAVNVASRLEHVAPVDGVLISHGTYRHVRGVFDVEELAPVLLRGRAETTRVYVVAQAKERAFRVASRGVEGVETHTIGRDVELSRLCAEYERCRAVPGVRLVLISGDAGVGKSRLLYEFRNWIELRREAVFVFAGRALLGREGQALGLMRDVIATRFDIVHSDPPEVVGVKLRAGLAPALGEDEADIVGRWLGFELGASDDEVRLRRSVDLASVARAHLCAWFATLTRDEPGVLLLEDLHWGDDETLDLVSHLAGRRDMRLLVVGMTRPTLVERRPSWAPDATRVELSALGPTACRELVGDILRLAHAVPDDLVGLIVDRADGNPFYVEELVKMLIDDGVITVGADGEPWTVATDRLDQSRVPATLTGVLQARLDGLNTTELIILQRAAVVGRVFWDQAVSALGVTERVVTAAALDDAVGRELVHRRSPPTFVGCAEFIFKHALLRDVTYETVLHRERAELHAAAAVWIEDVAGQRLSEFREVVAYHRELAGDPSGAAEQLLHAGLAAMQVTNYAASHRVLTKALELWDHAGVEPDARLYAPLVRALRVIGRLDDADAAIARGGQSSSITPPERARLLNQASAVASTRGEHDRERRELELARALAADDDLSLRSDIEMAFGWHHVALGHYDEATAAAHRALKLASSAKDDAAAAKAETILSMAAASRGDLEGGLLHAERELVHARASGDLHVLANAYGHVAVANHLLGDAGDPKHHRTGMEYYEAELHLCRRIGAWATAHIAAVNLAQLHLRLDSGADVRRLLAEARALNPMKEPRDNLLLLQVEADRRLTEGHLADGVAILRGLRALPSYNVRDEGETLRILSRVSAPPESMERLLIGATDVDLASVLAELGDEGDARQT